MKAHIVARRTMARILAPLLSIQPQSFTKPTAPSIPAMLGRGSTAARLTPLAHQPISSQAFRQAGFLVSVFFERKNKALDIPKRTYAECSPHSHALGFIIYFISAYIKKTLAPVIFLKPQKVFAFRRRGICTTGNDVHQQ